MSRVLDTPNSEPTPTDERPTLGFPMRLIALGFLTGFLIALSLWISLPYLHAITWGVALAIMGWPLHNQIKWWIPYPNLAAAVSTGIVILLIVIPGIFVVYQIGRETTEFTVKTGTTPDGLVSREKLVEIPGMSQFVEWMDRVNVDAETEIRKLGTSFVPEAQGLAQGSVWAIVQFLVAMFILFFAFRDRWEFMHNLRELLPLTRAESDRVFTSAADSVYANVYATVVTGLIDSVTGAILFWMLGLPAPILWGAVMFILSILPIVGAGLIWFPVAMYLALTGRWPAALCILTWGTITAIVIDYILYAKLAGERMRMHQVPALIAFLGGLAIFGVSGLILGPAIVAVTDAVLNLWRERNKEPNSVMSDAV